MDFHLEARQSLGQRRGPELFEVRHAISVNGQFRVGGEVCIDRNCCRRQFSPQLVDKVFAAPGKAKRIPL
uniref:hypothetical protein n=1 Tax=Rhizobium sp. PDO1-076 TaxID=1125979 RepID=UPI001FCAA5D5